MQLDGIASATTTNIGVLTVNGNGSLTVNATAGGLTTLNASSLSLGGSTLLVQGTTNSLGSNERVTFTTPPATMAT